MTDESKIEGKQLKNDQTSKSQKEFTLEEVPKLDEFYGVLVIGPSGSGKTTLC